MKQISVAQLRQNPSAALADVEHGETYIVTRYRREIARLTPPPGPPRPVTGEDLARILAETPVDPGWAEELARDRAADRARDPWEDK
jgi:antitoxin (DNA-binding transcriptional repressor) of toxin-antitoxin stability system